jgi:hypothetical protein
MAFFGNFGAFYFSLCLKQTTKQNIPYFATTPFGHLFAASRGVVPWDFIFVMRYSDLSGY